MDLLNQAIKIACKAHDGQVDKGGEPYILHPLRVMLQCETMDERIVAVLHDAMEDDPEYKVTSFIFDIFTLRITDAILAITRGHDESYKDYIIRCAKNDLALRVKMADLRDNLDMRRRKALTYLDACSRNVNSEYEDIGA